MNIIICVFIAICLTEVISLKIPVPSAKGARTVEDDDLLEKAIKKSLQPLGAIDVSVKDYKNLPGAYKVSLTTDPSKSDGNKEKLAKVLKDLGFRNASIEVRSTGDVNLKKLGIKDKFIVQLDATNYEKTMEAFVDDILATTNLKSKASNSELLKSIYDKYN